MPNNVRGWILERELKIYLYLLLILSMGIMISCDNSGAGGIFGSFDSRENQEKSSRKSASLDNNISQENYTSDNISDLLFVPGGSFYPATGSGKMTLSHFHIGKYEITRAEYYDIMRESPWLIRAYDPYSLLDVYSEEEIYRNPATGMNWFEAIVFCNRLSIIENLIPVYTLPGKGTNPDAWGIIPGTHSISNTNQGNTVENSVSLWNSIEANWNANGYRLPTKMEFLWAALGGTDSQHREFSGDTGLNHINDYAWNIANSGNNTHPVGRKRPNALGLFDMTGNAKEWGWDIVGIAEEIYKDFSRGSHNESDPPLIRNGIVFVRLPEAEQRDYRGPILSGQELILDSAAIQRVVAGGSWATGEENSSLTFREESFIDSRFPEQRDTRTIGFRVVRR